ncbi:hypothetical protein BIV04_03115 [Frigoribacterium sp. MCBA15_019]|nr:hypothetical protein BIV04_03115 [Frigoribacterium sp. MCBA15_019]
MRDQESESEAAFWRGQAAAVAAVKDVDAAVESLRAAGADVRAYEPYVTTWYAAVFSEDYPWSQPANAPAVSQNSLLALRGLATTLQFARPSVPGAVAARANLRGLVSEAREALHANSDELDAAELQYVFTLLTSVDTLLAETAVLGESNLREHIDRLNGALVSVAAKLRADGHEEAGNKLWGVALNIVGVYRGLLNDAGQWAAIASVMLQQLTDGSGS